MPRSACGFVASYVIVRCMPKKTATKKKGDYLEYNPEEVTAGEQTRTALTCEASGLSRENNKIVQMFGNLIEKLEEIEIYRRDILQRGPTEARICQDGPIRLDAQHYTTFKCRDDKDLEFKTLQQQIQIGTNAYSKVYVQLDQPIHREILIEGHKRSCKEGKEYIFTNPNHERGIANGSPEYFKKETKDSK